MTRAALVITGLILASGYWLGVQAVTGLDTYLRAIGL